MPAKAKEIERVARKLGFEKVRQKGAHARWKHKDGRATPFQSTAMLTSVVGYSKRF
jgi:predicted RNA binding protein YcfA (HicA-like mRNA interferase family)